MSNIDGYSADNIDTLLSHPDLDTVKYGLHILTSLCTTMGEYEALIGKVKIIQGKLYPPKTIQSYTHKNYIALWFVGHKASLSKAYAKKVHTLCELQSSALSAACLPDTMAHLSHLRNITINCSRSDAASMLGEGCVLRELALENVSIQNYRGTDLPPFLKGSRSSLRSLTLPRARTVLTLPSWLGDFTALETLGNEGFSVSVASLPVLSRLTSLKTLTFHHEATAFPAGVFGLTALEHLRIHFQHATNQTSKWDCVLPDRFSALPDLKTLALLVQPAKSIPRPLFLPEGLLRRVFSGNLTLQTSRSMWHPSDDYQPTIEKFEVEEFIRTGVRRQMVRGTVQSVPASSELTLRFCATLEGLTGASSEITRLNLSAVEQLSAAAWRGLLAFPNVEHISLPSQILREEMAALPNLRTLSFTFSSGSLENIAVLSRCRGLKTLTYRNNTMNVAPEFHQSLAHLDSVTIIAAEFPPACSALFEDGVPDASGQLAFRYTLDLRPTWGLRQSGVPKFRNQDLAAAFHARRHAEVGQLQLKGILDGLSTHPERSAEYEAGGFDTLDLSGLKLETLPESIGLLQGLRTLNLSNNALRCLPESLFSLRKLQALDLSGNRLVDLSGTIATLTQLETLSLADNTLITLPAELGTLAQLKHLDLSSNPFAALPLSLVSGPSIETLLLRGCSNLEDAWRVAGMPALQHLDLHSCVKLTPKVSPKTMTSREAVVKNQLKLGRWLKRQKNRTPAMAHVLAAVAALEAAEEAESVLKKAAERSVQSRRDAARRIAKEEEAARQQRYAAPEVKAAVAVLRQRFAEPGCSVEDIARLQEHIGALAALSVTVVVADPSGRSTVQLPEQDDLNPWLKTAGAHPGHMPLLALLLAASSGTLDGVSSLKLCGSPQPSRAASREPPGVLAPSVLAGLTGLESLRLEGWSVVGDWTTCSTLLQLSELELYAPEPHEDFRSLAHLPALRRVSIVQSTMTAAALASLPLQTLDRLELSVPGGIRTPTAVLTHFSDVEIDGSRIVLTATAASRPS